MAISFVQSNSGAAGPTPGTTFNLSFSSTTVSGNTVIVTVSTFNGAPSSVTDNKSNAYTSVGSVVEPTTSKTVSVWYSPGVTGGSSHQITVTQSTNTGYELIIEEYSGLLAASSFDVTVNATGSTTTANTGTSSTTFAENELVWSGVLVFGNQTDFSSVVTSVGAGYSNLGSAGSGSTILYKESKTVSSKSTYNATYTITAPAGFASGSPTWAAILATFKAPTLRTLAAAGSGVAALSQLKARFLTLAATSVGIVSLARRKSFFRTLAVVETPVVVLAKRLSKFISLSAIGHGLTNIIANKRVLDIGSKGRIDTPKIRKKPWVK